jgi:hypothetical protein
MSTRLEREYLEANSIEELNHALLVSAATNGDMHSVRELVEIKQTDVNYINEVQYIINPVNFLVVIEIDYFQKMKIIFNNITYLPTS